MREVSSTCTSSIQALRDQFIVQRVDNFMRTSF